MRAGTGQEAGRVPWDGGKPASRGGTRARALPDGLGQEVWLKGVKQRINGGTGSGIFEEQPGDAVGGEAAGAYGCRQV